MKKLIALAVVAVIMIGALLMTGCSSIDSTKLPVTLLVAEKFGDQDICDAAKIGADSLINDFAIDMKPYVECDGKDFAGKIKNALDTAIAERGAADQAAVVICVGDAFTDRSMADAYPECRFIWIVKEAYSGKVSENAVVVSCADNDEVTKAVYSTLASYIGGGHYVDSEGSMWGTSRVFDKTKDVKETQKMTEAETTEDPEEETEETKASEN